MTKLILLFSLCAVSTICQASPVAVKTAKENAAQFLCEHYKSNRAAITRNLKLSYSMKSKATGREVLYVFSRGKDLGFVIASGDDCAEPVLGFSDTGTFDAEQMSPATRWWLEGYQQEIEYAIKTGLQAQPRRTADRKDIAPMIETQWNQEAPYYNLCPIDERYGKHGWACCVAVATAQVMYYHKWPDRGTGSHSYEWQGKTLSADFGNTTYQWDKMKKTYSSWTEDTDDAIATLMYHCGVALEVNYGAYGSYAMFNNGPAMETYFGYSSDWKWYSRDNVGDEVFESALYNDLSEGHPVLYGGQDLNRNEGHQFVCDGYREGGYYHMNWGWGGWNDGYFLLSALNISDGRKWNWQQEIYCGIRKAESPYEEDGLIFSKNGRNSVTLTGGNAKENLVIPASVTIDGEQYAVSTIGEAAFKENEAITSITIPASVTTIKDDAFAWCKNLKNVIIEDSETPLNMGRYMFTECPIEKLYLGRSLTEVEPIFIYRPIKEVEFGQYVRSLSDMEFFCTDLESISIPASVSHIGAAAFGRCAKMKTINVNLANTAYCSVDGVLFDKDRNILIQYPCSKEGRTYVVPKSVTTIATYACYEMQSIECMTLPENLSAIEGNAFSCNTLDTLYVLNPTPPVCQDNTFTGTIPNNTTVFVPKGCLEAFKSAVGWNQLINIKEIEETGVLTLEQETKELLDVYSVSGKKLQEGVTSLEMLPQGIYIISPVYKHLQGKIARKIIVK